MQKQSKMTSDSAMQKQCKILRPGNLFVLAWLAAAATMAEAFNVAPSFNVAPALPGVTKMRPRSLRPGALLAVYEPAIRIGHGFDIHRLAPLDVAGQGCVIGGVTIPDFDLGTEAHSDGDVLYHSVTDAILGALTLPDIGQFFPDTDPRWKGCNSEVFLDEAWRQMDQRGYKLRFRHTKHTHTHTCDCDLPTCSFRLVLQKFLQKFRHGSISIQQSYSGTFSSFH